MTESKFPQFGLGGFCLTHKVDYKALFCRILRRGVKTKNPENQRFSGFFRELLSLVVVPLGLEPRTHRL